MTSSEMKKVFLESVSKQLTQYYTDIKQYDKDNIEQKHKIEGFMYAGVVLKLIDQQELTQLMEGIYFDIFQMTPTERKLMKEKGEKFEMDWSMYDVPTTKRKNN